MQRFVDYRENTSPIVEKNNARNAGKTSLHDIHQPAHSNGHYTRTRFDHPELQAKSNDRPYSAKNALGGLENLYQNPSLEERAPSYSFKYKREHRDHAASEQLIYGADHKRSNMNDFSFEDEFGHHASQSTLSNPRRENAWMKGLEAKMNNIDSMNEKINILLSMVKKDRSRERFDNFNDHSFTKKSVDIIKNKSKTNLTRPALDSVHQRQEENMYHHFQANQSDKKNKAEGNSELLYQSPYRTKPLSIRQDNIERKELHNTNYPQKFQRVPSEFLEKETQYQNKDISYSPLSRNRRKMGKNIDATHQESNLTLNDAYQPISPALRKEQTKSNLDNHQRSIEDMINERKMQRNVKQADKADKGDKYTTDLTPPKESARSNRNTPKHQRQAPRSALNDDEATNNRHYPTPSNGQLTQIRQRIAKLTNNKAQQTPTANDDKTSTQTGRIYKKTEASTPTRGSYANKRSLQIEVPDF